MGAFDMEIRHFTDRTYGIVAEFTGSLVARRAEVKTSWSTTPRRAPDGVD
jgi:hypothetical protein